MGRAIELRKARLDQDADSVPEYQTTGSSDENTLGMVGLRQLRGVMICPSRLSSRGSILRPPGTMWVSISSHI